MAGNSLSNSALETRNLPKNYTAVDIPNKEVLILVLKKDNDQLKRISELQEKQLKACEIQLETYAQRVVNAQKIEDTMGKLIKAYEDSVKGQEQQLQAAADYIRELSQKIEEMQAIIDGKSTG
jgi:Na+/phosphate symporter